ncbi:hypothetical protein HW114_02135 [Serratia symbiotica]|uniref:hypothetical protein n=1 Tax=Serratia symbiotica TaxID=138074 RepID=UPI001887C964|nr:hypothetical protein [Serratia symbiotica]MBF1994406.1 hypothetical protein [Serratia symbiotica]
MALACFWLDKQDENQLSGSEPENPTKLTGSSLLKDIKNNRHVESNYPEIPEGCVVVPLVPTSEMIEAAMNSIDVTFDDDDYIFVHHDTIYAAMLAAAPKLVGCK